MIKIKHYGQGTVLIILEEVWKI